MDIPFLTKKQPKLGLCCVYILPDTVVSAYVIPQANQPPLLQCIETMAYADPDSLKTVLMNLAKQHQLKGVKCVWLLNSENYQLVTLEKPEVEENEILQAIRWQVKKSVTYPLEEIAVNYVDLPLFYKKEEKTEIFVTVAHREYLQEMADLIFNLGFQLEYIDIPELALRNLNALYGDEDCYLGLLLLEPSGSSLLITHKKELLLTRSIPLSIEMTEEVALEIQRSFVYCQNQQQQAMPKKLLIAPANPELASYLSSQLEIEAEVLPMKKLLQDSNGFLDNLSHNQVIAIGGALRHEERANAAN